MLLSWQIYLLKAKIVTGEITDFTKKKKKKGSNAKEEGGETVCVAFESVVKPPS